LKKEDFFIGLEFYTGSGKWRCTDIGTRVIVAIRIDQVTVSEHDRENEPTASIVTDDQSWFGCPPYAVTEHVFDEFDMGGCSLDAEEFSEMQAEL
jgi:hypothetical protein